jgi:hypothetical protein
VAAPDEAAYCYALGAYLGDGCIGRVGPHATFMVVTLDSRYPGIVDEVAAALEATFPGCQTAQFLAHDGNATVVKMNHPALPFAFPQHGPGRKHMRAIELAGWQTELTRRHPRQLIRGLIHSDGCRTVNRFEVELPSGRVGEYAYPRYFFSNLSDDIRRIFCEHCELLGIRWTRSNPRNISIAHRDSVALLDEFVGPKR